MNLFKRLFRRKLKINPALLSRMAELSPPTCQRCNLQMVLITPRPGQKWQKFWGCSNHPFCRGVRRIHPETGKPETNDEVLNRQKWERTMWAVKKWLESENSETDDIRDINFIDWGDQ